MPSFTKIEIVQDAYSQMRISGITVEPTPRDTATALNRLEDMMATYADGRALCVNYEFENEPIPTSEHGVDRAHHLMMAANLGVKLCPDFGKDVPSSLSAIARSTYSASSGIAMRERQRQVAYPQRMPRGSGIRRFNRWRHHWPPNHPPMTSCANVFMQIGDVRDLRERFTAYLKGETIKTYTIEASSGLTISNDAIDGDDITYRVTASGGGDNDTDQTIVIVMTTSTDRITTRERLVELSPRTNV